MRLVALVTGPVDLGGAAVQYSVGPASLRAGVVGQSPSGLCALCVGRGWLVSFVFAVWREALEVVLLCARQRAASGQRTATFYLHSLRNIPDID